MSEPFRIAIAGLGTVGTGVIRIIQQHHDLIAKRAGRPLEIIAVTARDKAKARDVDISSYRWVDSVADLPEVEKLDAVVELIGGSEGVARELVEKSLQKGIAVSTANKALLAIHGFELARLANDNNVSLTYEPAVAGGIPVIKAIKEGFAANEINAVYGILNGTCNYILTEMRETGRDFDEVLKEAQVKGYAEADPTFDVEGVDAAHKLCILSALSFGVKPDFEALKVTGISHITAQDIANAEELGCRIKLLGIARKVNGQITQSVEPCLVDKESPIAAVDGVYNAAFIDGDFVDTGLLVGRGAGEGPTASAVVADLIDLARGLHTPVFGIPANDLVQANWANTGDIVSPFYLHLTVLDKPGVLADISSIMRDHDVSMEVILQRGRDPEKPVSIVIKSHAVRQADIRAAVDEIAALEASTAEPCLMRIVRI